MCASVMSLGQFVVVQTRCNWHFHDINIYFLLRKKTCIVVANLCPSMFCLQVKSLDILVSSSYKYTQHGILEEICGSHVLLYTSFSWKMRVVFLCYFETY
jgi:hypothetical protein